MSANPNSLGNRRARAENVRTDDACLPGYEKHRFKQTRNELYGDCWLCSNCQKFFSLHWKRLDGAPEPSDQAQQRNMKLIKQLVPDTSPQE